ncbi:MAG: DEAD/DEAH box helicase [bacterium]|nr:DEAD/DEAH box helicase [bacterium]
MLDWSNSCIEAARVAYRAERACAVQAALATTPIRDLRRFSDGQIRYGAFEAAGIRTVGAVLGTRRSRLEMIHGVGSTSSARILSAARRLEEDVHLTLNVRFDIDRRPSQQTDLLNSLRALDGARRRIRPLYSELEAAAKCIDADFADARVASERLRRMFALPRRKKRAEAAFGRLRSFLNEAGTRALASEIDDILRDRDRPNLAPAAIWDDYETRAASYNGLLAEINELDSRGDPERPRGGKTAVPVGSGHLGNQRKLPEAIARRVNAFELDVSLLGASLRGYQDFGAKFALVQERVILGDEMGLGKTIEALAVLCHLRSQGATHFLVVCPASVLTNWENEILRHSHLPTPVRLHGHDRLHRLRDWTRDGGVAITTFDTLRLLPTPETEIAVVVVDEAHYIKNPEALRTGAVRACLKRSIRALLMTGTPLENRLEEFQTLVGHVRPDVAAALAVRGRPDGVAAFHAAVSPVYLRRNLDEVLDELPPLIEVTDWLTLDGAAAETYRRSVAEGNFMAMRRAAFLTRDPADSPKLTRLREIADEAADNNRKVIVYSYFRDVLNRVHAALGSRALGPLTGSVTGRGRQDLVDRFSAQREPAVLVSQIEAGGVGLNIQAASVVIIAEPQWKPSTEIQAIARCHRMGQTRPVEVHRLLTKDSVDEHMIAVLARKSEIFAQYVRPSAVKDATPAAIDRTATHASQSADEARILELERRRLGLAA